MTHSDRLSHLIARIGYVKYLLDVLVADQLSQSIVLSAYATNDGEVINEPLYVFSRFSTTFQDGVYDYSGNPLETQRHLDHLNSFRFLIAQSLRSQRGHPVILTLILAILFKTLSIPFRLCVGVEEAHRKLSYDEEKAILFAQRSNQPWRLPQLNWPTIWLEVYWHEINGFVPIELYSFRFCFNKTFSEIPPLRTVKLKPAEIRGPYIEKFRPRLLQRLSPLSSLKIDPPIDSSGKKPLSSFQALMLSDSDDESSESDNVSDEDGEDAQAKSIIISQPKLIATGPIDHSFVRQMTDEALKCALISEKKSQRTSSSPLKDVQDSSIMDEVLCVLGVDNSGRILNLTSRYFPKKLSIRRREYEKIASKLLDNISQPIVTDATLWHVNQMDTKFLNICRTNTSIPSSLEGCTKHPLFAVKSKLTPYESLKPDAKIAGYVKSEEVYFRKDVVLSLPTKDWLKRGRIVPNDTSWHHEVTVSKKLKDSNNRVKISVPVFTFSQTIPLTEDIYRMKLADEGNTTIVKGLTLPSGFIHLRESSLPGIVQAAIATKQEFKQAIVDFRFLSGALRAVKDGIIIHTDFVRLVLEKQRDIKRNRLRKQNWENTSKAYKWWKVTFKMITALDHD